MKRFIAVTASPTGATYTIMASEALQKIALALEHKISGENSADVPKALSGESIAAADVVILATDVRVEKARFAKALIEAAAELAGIPDVRPVMITPGLKKFVAVTVSSDGIAHTFITATSLQKAAKALGYEIKVETQDPITTSGSLTAKEIADAVIIATEAKIDMSRFVGKQLYLASPKETISDGKKVLNTALTQLPAQRQKSSSNCCVNVYTHLLTGISYMLPMVTAGGLAIALGFTFSNIYSVEQKQGTLAWALHLIGSGIAFQLFVAMLSGFIAFSIADRFGLVPGMIGGMLAQHFGAGFLGGIASGFLAGYLTKFLAKAIRLPDIFKGLKAILILPLLSSLLVGLTMIYLIAPPMYLALHALTGWLSGLQEINALFFGTVLGVMMAVDIGGPINKAATTFAIGLLASKIYTPMATVMIAGMTPPLGLAVASWLLKNRFDTEEREAAGSAFLLGLSFVTEGAILFAAKDPLHVIPALIGGSAVSGAIAMSCGVELLVPHGGLFATMIPAAVTQVGAFFVSLVTGITITVGLLALLKQPRTQASYG